LKTNRNFTKALRKKSEIKRMRIKMKKTKHGKLSLMKNKIVKRNSELYKKVKEKKLKSKRTCIKFEIQTN
jgi:hypothetical protein